MYSSNQAQNMSKMSRMNPEIAGHEKINVNQCIFHNNSESSVPAVILSVISKNQTHSNNSGMNCQQIKQKKCNGQVI